MSSIEVRNLCRSWGDVNAVKNVSFTVPDKSFTVLLGPSGCGKSTILRMISGLEQVTSGNIIIGGQDVTNTEASKRGVSMVFQSYALFPHLTVSENIQFGLKVRKVPAKERQERVLDAANVVGLSEILERRPANLSGGQRQRVALARSIVSEQTVCLMDEPLSNLDSKLRAEMRDEIRSLQQRLNLTVVYVTHDQVEAMSMADQIILLKFGEIVQQGAPAELYTQPNSVFSAQFIGVPPMNVLALEQLQAERLPESTQAVFNNAANTASIGVRPEHISFAEQGLPVEVFGVDYFGGETVFRVRHGQKDFFVREPGQPRISTGEKLHVNWNTEDMYCFDKAEQRLYS